MVRGTTLAVLLVLVAMISSTQGLDWPHRYVLNWTLALPKHILHVLRGDEDHHVKETEERQHFPPSLAVPVPLLPEPKSDTFLSTPQKLAKYDYQSERHVVRTKDDYLISLDRIPHGKKKFVAPFTKPVILVRSMFSSSHEFIFLGPQDALAYKLADAGFDVWMLNLRGVFPSQGHVSLVATDPHFWNFSWHEMGVFDVTAALDYVLSQTHHNHVHMVGYDMGATAMLVALSERPEYNSKIRLAVLMAPLAFTDYTEGPLKILAQHIVPEMFGAPSSQPIMSQTALEAISDISSKMCNMPVVSESACRNLTNAMRFILDTQMSLKDVPMTVDQTPDMESLKTLLHYVQGIQTGKFQQYDLGVTEENVMRYSKSSPPEYDLSKVKAPVAIFMSQEDTFAAPPDVERLKKNLPNVIDTWYSKELTHMDFIFNDRAHHHMYKVPLVKSKNINLHLDSQYRAEIEVGTPKQKMSCLVQVASDITAVAGKDCSKGCDHVQHRFDPSLSTTFKSNRVTQAEDWEHRFSASGQYGIDTFWVNNTEVPEQSLIVANVLESGYAEIGVDGIVGLNNGGNTIFQNMIDRKMLEKNIMFIYHERHSEENHAGQIIFGAVDKSHIQGEPTYVPLISDKSWAIKVDEVSMDGSSVCKDCQGYVDTSIAIVKGPEAFVSRINEKIGCKQTSNNRCLVDCSAIGSLKPVVFTLGGHDFELLPQYYIQKEGDSCWSGFVADTQSEFWRWGDFFLDHIYVIFDHDNNSLGVAHAKEHDHQH